MTERAGTLVQNLTGDAAYWSFRPSPLPPEPALTLDSDMRQMLVTTSRALTNLERLALLIPSTDLFIAMYVRKEALLSSQIEARSARWRMSLILSLIPPPISTLAKSSIMCVRHSLPLSVCSSSRSATACCVKPTPCSWRACAARKKSRRISPQSKLDRPRRLWPQRCALHSAKCR